MRTLTPEKLQKYWDQLFSITIVDPTCGSGAFLLAALAFLEELTLDALTRADELTSDSKKNAPAFAKEHATKNLGQRRLAIRTNFIIKCLYGADLSGEAVEIARLRLYLALVATTSVYEDLRPLPDLEFNLAEGNLLVGVNSEAEMEQLIGSALWAQGEIGEVRKRLAEVSKAISAFNAAQQTNDHVKQEELKIIAMQRATGLKEQLNVALHKAMSPESQYPQWLKSHEPLHYLAQFPSVMLGGGFDVVIGNPPYIKNSNMPYEFSNIPLSALPNIYAPCTARAFALMKHNATFGFIVMHNLMFHAAFEPLRSAITNQGRLLAIGSFGKQPSGLFAGVAVRNAVIFSLPSATMEKIQTRYAQWNSTFRGALLNTLRWYSTSTRVDRWDRHDGYLLEELLRLSPTSDAITGGDHALFCKKVAGVWLPVLAQPFCNKLPNGELIQDPAQMTSSFRDQEDRDAAYAILSSRVAWLWWQAIGDDYNVTSWFLSEMPGVHFQLGARQKLAAVGKKTREFIEQNPQIIEYRPRLGHLIGNVDTRALSNLTDNAVWALVSEFGLTNRWDEFEASYWRAMKVALVR
jgi:hypothetical protein